MKELFFKLKKLIFAESKDPAQKRRDIRTKTFAAAFLCMVSVILTVMNIINHYTFMACTTGILIIGFLTAAVLCGKFRKIAATDWIMAVMCCLIFTVYAVTGENEGFACLWILLMPLLGLSILTPFRGICTSVYFQLFLIIFFYTPLHNVAAEYNMYQNHLSVPTLPRGYTETFMIRFPVLYFCDMGMSMLLSLQKQHYYLKAEDQAHMDVLTGLSNRNMYIEYIDQLAERPLNEELIIITLDLNCLKINNDTLGHEAGDEMLIGTAECMRTAFEGADLLCRSGGDEFIVITFKSKKVVEAQIAHFRSLTVAHQGKLVNELTVSLGMCALRDHPGATIPELVKIADDLLYEEKEAYYRSAGLERRRRG